MRLVLLQCFLSHLARCSLFSSSPRLLGKKREGAPGAPSQGDLKKCEVTYRFKEVTVGEKTYKPGDIVVARADIVRSLVDKGTLVIREGGYRDCGRVSMGDGVSLPVYIPWRSESEKQNAPNQKFGDVLVLVKLQKHVLVYAGALKVEVGEFFLPYWLVAQLSLTSPAICPGRKAPSES
jgi:hypothetical protein